MELRGNDAASRGAPIELSREGFVLHMALMWNISNVASWDVRGLAEVKGKFVSRMAQW
jgi:hypothetical protein